MADGPDEGALADIRKPEQPDVRHDAKLEFESSRLSGTSWFAPAGCPIDGRGEVSIPAASLATLGDQELLLVRQELTDDLTRFRVAHDGADRDPQALVTTAAAILVAPTTIFPLLCADLAGVLQVEERVLALVADENDTAAVAAVAAGGTAEGYVGLATKRRTAVSTGTCLDHEAAFIDEPHECACNSKARAGLGPGCRAQAVGAQAVRAW